MSRDLWITKHSSSLHSANFQITWIRRVRRVEHTTSESFCYVLVRKSYLAFDWAPTLGARGFSCAVSVFGQVLKSDPREPLVYSTFGRTRFRLQPTKRRSPSHARKNLWYPGYWAPGNSKTVCNVCGERSWSRILASFFKKIPLHQDIFRFSESRTLSQIPKMPPWVSVKRFFRYYRQAVLDIIYFKNRIFTYS